VITGAADGIGRALAERFGRADYAVTGVDVDEQRSKQTRDELKALGIDIRFVIRDS
jgi:NAD(P)-dependent dehydrogenase (short-subunit alcohol dehydrogenase family)